MRRYLLALFLLAPAVFGASHAANDTGRGTIQEQRACTRDVQRHCRSVIDQGDFTVLACLKENRAKISAACDRVLRTHGQ